MARRTANGALDLLSMAYEALVKAGENSLSAAWTFGQQVDALHGAFSYEQMGRALGVTGITVSTYARLYRRYPTEQALLHTAQALGTYDVSKLNGSKPVTPSRFHFRCADCGSTAVVKEPEAGPAVAQEKVTVNP